MSTSRRGRTARRAGTALRRIARPAGPQERAEDRIAAIAQHAGAPVDDVLREVADFRLALETDMLIAAAALEADEATLAAGVLDDERAELAEFQERVLERLAGAAAEDELARRRDTAGRLTLTTRAVAAAAAAVTLIVGGATLRSTGDSAPTTEDVALARADGQLATLSRATLGDDTDGASVAAKQLHRTILRLIDEHGTDPKVAEQIAALLTNDLALIKSQPQLQAAIAEALNLVKQLQRSAPPSVKRSMAPLIAAATPSPSPSPKATTKPSPKASPSPSSSPSATSSSSESPDDNPLPGTPGGDSVPGF